MADEQPFYDDAMTLRQYAELTGKTERSVERMARLGRIPTWADPSVGPGKITSPKAVAHMQHMAAQKGVQEFMAGKTVKTTRRR